VARYYGRSRRTTAALPSTIRAAAAAVRRGDPAIVPQQPPIIHCADFAEAPRENAEVFGVGR
jgi:hypothetical protein